MPQEVTRADFPLPTLAPVLEGIRQSVLWGRGFQLIRGEHAVLQVGVPSCCSSAPKATALWCSM